MPWMMFLGMDDNHMFLPWQFLLLEGQVEESTKSRESNGAHWDFKELESMIKFCSVT
jgi:hypothetical protein